MELEQWLSSRLRVSNVSSEMQCDWKNYFGFLVEEISRMIRAFGLPAILSTGERHRQCDHAKLDNVAILVCTSSENLSTTNTK